MPALPRLELSLALASVILATTACGKREAVDTAAQPTPAPASGAAANAAAAVASAAGSLNPLPAASTQVDEVMNTFLAAKSFHVTMTTLAAGREMTMEMDFVAPDRYRLRMPTGTQYVVGDTMYMTMNGRTMKMPLPKGQVGSFRDPTKYAEHRATMKVEAAGADVVDGQPAKKYVLHNSEPMPVDSTMWVGTNGYPLKIDVKSDAKGVNSRTTIRYSRFNDPTIRIDPPQ